MVKNEEPANNLGFMAEDHMATVYFSSDQIKNMTSISEKIQIVSDWWKNEEENNDGGAMADNTEETAEHVEAVDK